MKSYEKQKKSPKNESTLTKRKVSFTEKNVLYFKESKYNIYTESFISLKESVMIKKY